MDVFETERIIPFVKFCNDCLECVVELAEK